MPFLIAIISFLLIVPQSPQDAIRQHYESAEAARLAGNLVAAEDEYKAILAEAFRRLGRVYSARSDYPLAIATLEDAQRYNPESTETLLDLAIAYFGAEQYDRALIPAGKVLLIAPNDPGAHQMLGKSYFMLGDLGKSIAELETAVKLEPNNIDVAYTLGIAYLRDRQPDRAKQLYNSLITSLGEQPQLHVLIGRAYRQSGLLTDAADEFKKAIALDDHFPRAHYYLGMTYLLDEGQSKIGEALEQFKIEVADNPDEFFGNYYLGVVYNFQRQWDLAIPFLQKASAIQPNNPDPYFQLGQAYQEVNKHEQAIVVLKQAIALNPNLAHNKNQVTTAHHRLAQSLLKTGQTEAGRKELQIAADLKAESFKLEQQPDAKRTSTGANSLTDADRDAPLTAQTQLALQSGEFDEAKKQELLASETYYKKLLGTAFNNIGLLRSERLNFLAAAEQFALAAKWNPEQQGLDYNLGLAYYKAHAYKEALPPLQNEVKLHSENKIATTLLGMTLFMSEDYAKAAEWLRVGIDGQSTDINALFALGSSLVRLGKADAVETVIAQLKTVANDTPQLHLLLAETYEASGDRIKALAELEQFASSSSNVAMICHNAGILYLKLQKRDEAVKEFENELQLNPDDVKAKYALASVLLTGKNVDRGIALVREVIAARPDYEEALFALGKALLARNEIASSIDVLERASKLSPENAEVHFELGQAYVAAGRKAEGKNQVDLSRRLRSQSTSNH